MIKISVRRYVVSAIPLAPRRLPAGWLGGAICIISVAIINGYTMLVIADLSEWHPTCHSYSEIAHKIFGYKFKLLVDATLFILQLSFCAGQLYFIGNQIDAVVCHSTGGRD